MEKIVNVIGAGLAGVEACHQLVKRGYKVRLYEMRPKKMTPAHHSGNFAELVCSNSLRADGTGNAVGVLKAEMEMMDSLIIKYARKHQVPAGGALAVDRNNFSQAITEYIQSHPLIEVIHEEAKEFPAGYTIIASGPLTSDALATAIKEKLGEDYFYFFDAAICFSRLVLYGQYHFIYSFIIKSYYTALVCQCSCCIFTVLFSFSIVF